MHKNVSLLGVSLCWTQTFVFKRLLASSFKIVFGTSSSSSSLSLSLTTIFCCHRYGVLSSESGKKSVRWWNLITNESHIMRDWNRSSCFWIEGQRHGRALEAVALNWVHRVVLGYKRDGLVARFDSNGELGFSEEVHGVCSVVGVGLELAAGDAVRVVGFVLVNPALEKAELVLLCVQVKLQFQGHHVLVRHEAVDAAAIDDGFRRVICPKVERMMDREHWCSGSCVRHGNDQLYCQPFSSFIGVICKYCLTMIGSLKHAHLESWIKKLRSWYCQGVWGDRNLRALLPIPIKS